jgi:hypothetical protein
MTTCNVCFAATTNYVYRKTLNAERLMLNAKYRYANSFIIVLKMMNLYLYYCQ